MPERLGHNAGPVHRAGLSLTPRQAEILSAYARGERTGEIKIRLGIASKTLEGHIENAKARLGARTVRQAVAMYALLKDE